MKIIILKDIGLILEPKTLNEQEILYNIWLRYNKKFRLGERGQIFLFSNKPKNHKNIEIQNKK